MPWHTFLFCFLNFLSTGIWGPHLIVVRTCKLLNWEMEFKRWCPGLKILLYLGNKRERRATRMVVFDLFLHKQGLHYCLFQEKIWHVDKIMFILQWWRGANSFHVCVTSYKLLMKDQCHFLRKRWRHLVLDEVPSIKNMSEKHWETIFALRRWAQVTILVMMLGFYLHPCCSKIWKDTKFTAHASQCCSFVPLQKNVLWTRNLSSKS